MNPINNDYWVVHIVVQLPLWMVEVSQESLKNQKNKKREEIELIRGGLPSSHYQLGSVSRSSGTLLLPRFSGPSRASRRTFLAEREGGVPGGSSRTLGDPPWGALSLPRKVLREPRGGPENLGRRRVPEVRDTEPS